MPFAEPSTHTKVACCCGTTWNICSSRSLLIKALALSSIFGKYFLDSMASRIPGFDQQAPEVDKSTTQHRSQRRGADLRWKYGTQWLAFSACCGMFHFKGQFGSIREASSCDVTTGQQRKTTVWCDVPDASSTQTHPSDGSIKQYRSIPHRGSLNISLIIVLVSFSRIFSS